MTVFYPCLFTAENSLGAEVYVSDDDDSFTTASNSRTPGGSDTKME